MKKILSLIYPCEMFRFSAFLTAVFFLLPISGKTQCPNDECSGAIVLTMHQDDCMLENFSRIGCTGSGGPACGNGSADMWFEVTSTQSAFVLSVNMAAWDCRGAVGVFDACGGSLLLCAIVPLASGVWDIPVNLPAGTYKIRLQRESADTPPGSGIICDGWGGLVFICAWEGACAYTQVTTTGVVPTCGEANGSVTAFPTGGGPYTYSWSNGGTTQTISNLGPGYYTVTVTSNNGCTAVGYHVLHEGADFTFEVTSTPAGCSATNGTATAVVQQFDPPISYTFEWSNGGSTQTITGLAPGTYTVTVSGTNWNNSTCVKTGSTTVTVNNPINVTITTTQANCGMNNGSATANPTGGSGYTYAWSNGGSTQTINNLAAGTYTVTVTASNGCTNTASATVTQGTSNPISVTASATHTSCGQGNGSATANASGGSGYTYAWSNGGTTQTINNLAAGNYTVTVTAGNGCTNTASATVNSSTGITATTSSTHTTCGQSNGSATANPTGGSGYTYAWSSGETTQTISNLPAGTYTVTVTAGNGCTNTASATINSSTAVMVTATSNPSTCGFPNGTATANPSGGSGYTYAWSTGQSIQTIINLYGGTYFVTVTASNGCTGTAGVDVSPSDALTATVSTVHTTCGHSNGSATVTPVGGSGFTFAWSNGGNTQTISNLAAGNYSVTVSNSQGCTVTASAAINSSIGIGASASAVAATCGQNNGSVDLSVSGGGAPLTYLWSNGAATEDLSGVAPGTYDATVTNSNGCTAAAGATVQNVGITPILAGTSTPNSACSPANGSVNLTVTPAGSYTFLWSNGATTEDIAGLASGAFSVTVSQGNCTANQSFVVGNNVPEPDTTALFDTTCEPGEAGVFVQNLTNASGCDSVVITSVSLLEGDSTWVTGATCEAGGAGVFVQNLVNVAGCDSTVITTVILSPGDSTLLFETSCNIGNTGVFTQNLINQYRCDSTVVTTVAYAESDTTYFSAETCDPGSTGTFTQILTTPEGCDSLVITTVTLAPADTTLIFAETCDADEVGIFTETLSASGGCDSVVITTMALAPADTTLLEKTSCDPDAAGVFTEILAGENGCDSVVITTISLVPADTTLLHDTSCNPDEAGVFTQIFAGGNGCDSVVVTTVIFAESDTTLRYETSCQQASTGVFTQLLANENGCDSVVITTVAYAESDTILVAANTCDPDAAGIFMQNLVTSEGCDSLVITTVTLVPSDTISLEKFSCDPTAAGIFTEIFTNENGCDRIVTTTVTWTPLETTFVTTPTCDPALAGTSETATYQSAEGCDSTVVTTWLLTDPPMLALSTSDFNGFEISCSGAADGSASASATGGTPGYAYLWNTGETTPAISSLAPGTYSLTLTDQLGCTQTQSSTLTEPPALVVDLISIMNASAGQSNGSIEVSASGGVGTLKYSWTDMAGVEIGGQPSVSGLPAGTYTLSVTDANGCVSLSAYTIQSVSKTKDLDLESRIQLFPNPTDGQVTLRLEGGPVSCLAVEVFDALGQRVASHPKVDIAHGSGRLDLSGYAPGYYLLKMVIGDQAVVKRLAVSR